MPHSSCKLNSLQVKDAIRQNRPLKVPVDPSEILQVGHIGTDLYVIFAVSPMTEEDEASPSGATAIYFLPEDTEMMDEDLERAWVSCGFIGRPADGGFFQVLVSHWLDSDDAR